MTALFPTYGRYNLAVAKAEGTVVEDINGKKYLDFGSGIGVCNLGHQNPIVKEAVQNQLDKYWHMSNLYHIPIQEEVAKLLTDHSCCDYVFFCNSGAEANEAAIKLARKATGKDKIVTFNKSFHGRTFATMAATGQDKVRTGYGTMLQEFAYATYNDSKQLKEILDTNTAAVMLEVVQGEGGVIPADPVFLAELERICKEKGILIIVDEIQTGIGRTGKAFGYQHYDLLPDIITVAKGLGNGLPVGGMMAKANLRDAFGPGSHGSTFGGNPLAMSAAKAVLSTAFAEDFLQEVQSKAAYLQKQLQEKIAPLKIVKEVRGKGLMIGIDCGEDVSELVPQLIEKGLLALNASPQVIRLLPPLTVTEEEIDRAVELLVETLKNA